MSSGYARANMEKVKSALNQQQLLCVTQVKDSNRSRAENPQHLIG